MGLHGLTIPNCPKSWELILWQFLLVIVLSFTTIDEDSGVMGTYTLNFSFQPNIWCG